MPSLPPVITPAAILAADKQVIELLCLYDQASRSASAMIEFNTARYILIHDLALVKDAPHEDHPAQSA